MVCVAWVEGVKSESFGTYCTKDVMTAQWIVILALLQEKTSTSFYSAILNQSPPWFKL